MKRLVMLPGLGADARLFEPQRREFPGLEVPPWLPPVRGETLADYGRRMAAQVKGDGPLCLGGVSFGGMVAVEMARHLPAERVVLVSSCTTGDAVRRSVARFEPLNAVMPTAAFAMGKPLAGLLVKGLPSPHYDLFVEMFRDTPARFVKWAVSAIVRWRGPDRLDAPLRSIHGARDFIIPVERVEPERVLRDGGHLINLTHAEQVNAFLRDVVSGA